ncbi:T7SS effector LXG polymorphic toxin [Listeria fleischmannii]|uniref:LXG domain-containing protein n=1 Tax=Listeria fleischmannii TaxID=1069827 RepID=A0A841YJ04_9LIST|nr:T7SS effector LXG polymorphic toxin [Listeria fleischmannii]MBC1399937.1 hypothetical protein [Listeria fleischmannii]
MSVDMYVSKSKAQATSTSQVCQEHLEGYEALQKAISQFTLEPFLKGKAYDSAKAFYSAVLYPLVQGGILLTEATEEAVQKFPERYQSEVDSGDLKEAELEEQIRKANDLINQANALQTKITQSQLPETDQRTQLNLNQALIEAYQTNKEDLEDKLRKLRAFHASSPSIFSEITSLKQAIDQGIAQTKTAWNASTGTFVISNDLSWRDNITQKWQERELERSGEAGFISSLQEQYGFDKETAKIMAKLYKNMKKGASEDEDINKMFYNLIGSYVYSSLAWKMTSDAYSLEEQKKLMLKYGISNKEYEKLKIEILAQHGAAGADTLNDFEAYAKLNGLKSGIEDYYSKYAGKTDMAHQYITTAAILDSGVRNTVTGVGANYLYGISTDSDIHAGWGGDIFGTNGAAPSLGNDDYKADLDAVNIANRLQSNNSDLFKVNDNYYSGIKNGRVNRADEFLTNLGDGDREAGIKRIDDLIEKRKNEILVENRLNWGKGIPKMSEGEENKMINDHLKVANDFRDNLYHSRNNLGANK